MAKVILYSLQKLTKRISPQSNITRLQANITKKDLMKIHQVFLCWHLLIFPGSCPPSIFSASELNFCVRYGNRWTLTAINTNSYGWLWTIFYIKSVAASNNTRIIAPLATFVKTLGDPWENRTPVTGVRGRCLNRLTNGPWCTFRDSNPGPTD